MKKLLKEGVWITTPEAPVKLWIVNEDDPDMSCGYIESVCKEDVLLLQIRIQKLGYKVVYSKPKGCIYARGIPSKILLGDKTYIEFSNDKYNDVILDAIKETAKGMKLSLTPTSNRGLSKKEEGQFSNNNYWKKNKNKTFHFQQGLKEAVNNKNDYNYSHVLTRFSFEEVKDFMNNPKKLAKYCFDNPEFVSSAQPVFEYAEDKGKEIGFEKGYYPEWVDDGALETIDFLKKLTNDFSNPKQKITLYRGVVIFEAEPDLKEPSICWSYEEEGAIDWVEAICSEDDPNDAPCILTGETTVDNVDWLMTFLLLTACPEEKEIRIWDDSKIKVVDWEVL